MTATVLAPVRVELPPLPPGTPLLRFGSSAELIAALKGVRQAVLVSDGLEDLPAVAAAIRANGVEVIEVHSAGWDGETHSLVTEACRGVIGGFGLAAVPRALEAFEPAAP